MERTAAERHRELQAEVQEIADILAQQQGKLAREVWQEALTLHRVRYETVILPPPTDDRSRKA